MSTVRINEKIKSEVIPILEDLGISLSETINMFLHQVKLNNGIPFEVKRKGFVDMLAKGETLPEKHKNHPLKGIYEGYFDCHILPDWLLICKLEKRANFCSFFYNYRFNLFLLKI